MTKAIIKLHLNGKFELGAWVAHLGSPSPFLNNILKRVNLKDNTNLSYDIWSNITLFANHHTWRYLKVPKKKIAFNTQVYEDGTAKTYCRFWGVNLNEYDLMNNGLFADWEYTMKVNKKKVKIEVKYQGEYYYWEGTYKSLTEVRETLIQNLEEWGAKIDKELADCDCHNN